MIEIAAVINLISILGNLIWSWRLRQTQGNGQIIAYWKAECEKKDHVINDMIRRKNTLKRQYETLLAQSKHVEGQLKTYKNMHGHEIVASR